MPPASQPKPRLTIGFVVRFLLLELFLWAVPAACATAFRGLHYDAWARACDVVAWFALAALPVIMVILLLSAWVRARRRS